MAAREKRSRAARSSAPLDRASGAGKAAVEGLHIATVGNPVGYHVSGHAARSDSPTYRKTRVALQKIVSTVSGWYYAHGRESYEDHHGGGLWVCDQEGWFFVRNLAGIEWASQFCADPKKVDGLRRNARRLFAAFPKSFAAYKALGIDLRRLLETPITNARRVAEWTDSICNASVPLPRRFHTGCVPEGGGVHNYPSPVIEIERFKYDDFELWVRDDEGQLAAVVPVARRGSHDGRVRVIHATVGTKLHRQVCEAEGRDAFVEAGEKHRMAREAFRGQGGGTNG